MELPQEIRPSSLRIGTISHPVMLYNLPFSQAQANVNVGVLVLIEFGVKHKIFIVVSILLCEGEV